MRRETISGSEMYGNRIEKTMHEVYNALREKNFNPVIQMTSYLLSEDPAFITSHDGARKKIAQFERYEILEELVSTYLGAMD